MGVSVSYRLCFEAPPFIDVSQDGVLFSCIHVHVLPKIEHLGTVACGHYMGADRRTHRMVHLDGMGAETSGVGS